MVVSSMLFRDFLTRYQYVTLRDIEEVLIPRVNFAISQFQQNFQVWVLYTNSHCRRNLRLLLWRISLASSRLICNFFLLSNITYIIQNFNSLVLIMSFTFFRHGIDIIVEDHTGKQILALRGESAFDFYEEHLRTYDIHEPVWSLNR